MQNLAHNLGHSIELRVPDREQPVWRYVYGDGKPKPYFHPITSPATGVPLTLFEPSDHFWHRGLWFTIKYVNGDNFWEEKAPFGVQETVGVPQAYIDDGNQIRLEHALLWKHPDGRAALTESRTIAFSDSGGFYQFDWTSRLTVERDTLFDRTPFTTWGGYGGLTWRASRGLRETHFLCPGDQIEPLRRGEPSPWCELRGRLDGGEGLRAGIAILDHPENPRYPTPYYGHAGENPGGPFLNSAFLFHEPLSVAAGETITLRYRVIVHEGEWDAERYEALHREFANH